MTPPLTVGILLAILTLGGSGIGAYTSVKEDIAVNSTKIDDKSEANKERFDDIKEDTKEIRELLNELLRERRDE
jgi:hypothetical protein